VEARTVKTHSVGLGFVLGLWLLWLLWLAGPSMAQTADATPPAVDIEVFTRAGCPRCAAAKRFLDDLQQERPELWIVVHDVGQDPTALARLKKLAVQLGVQTLGVPTFALRGELLIGFLSVPTTGGQLKALLDKPSALPEETVPAEACPAETTTSCPPATPALPAEVDAIDTPWLGRLSVRALGLPIFTLVVGLLDSFNPCALWVLLFLLSLLVNLQDRAKMLLIGGTFVATSGLLYFAFIAAWLNVFLWIGLSRATQVVLGGIAVLVGSINVKDFFALGRGVSLSIPAAAKPGLYTRMRRILQAENLRGALVGVVGLAMLVNTIELLCTAGFPAVYTRILTLRQLPWWAYYGYLGLYNMAYIFDDSVMLLIAVVTLGRRKLPEQEGRWLKLISGMVMLGLGLVLLAKPGWLMV
jgi:glutaredoxin